ncbi:MAG: heavy metal translocating P-type ATPase [bacterium]|nr:heavy metal translocating P-type ATPase [bacterium]
MIIEIMFAGYLGTRLYEKYKERQKKKQLSKKGKGNKQNRILTTASTKKLKPTPAAITPAGKKRGNGNEHQLKRCQHFANISLASMGLFALGRIFPISTVMGMAAYIYAAFPYMRDVEKSLVKDRKVNVDVLFFSADVLTLAVGQYFTAGVGLWLMHYGKTGALKARDDSQKMLSGVFEQLPQKVWVLINNVEIEIPLEQIRPADILVVGAGETIPVDGTITQGMASIDQQALTGEAQPAEKETGHHVHANTIIIAGRIHIRVEKSGEETTAAKITELLLHAVDYKSDVQLKGEEWANKATLPMLVTAGLTLPLMGPVTTAVLINSHIGNRIRLLAPLGTLQHISMAAKMGLLVKDGRALEKLCDIDTVIFDKTGTLTTGEPEVSAIIPCNSHSEKEILTYAATAESKLTHPIAKAILNKAAEQNITSKQIDDSNYRIGYGITVYIDNKTIRVGSSRFIESEAISIRGYAKRIANDSRQKGNTIVLVAVDDNVAGLIELQPKVRPEAATIISQLKQLGIKHTAIVSGDHCLPTQKLAEDLGMDEFFYDILPEEKARIVQRLKQKNRKVCFIGDGINDAIAMKKADVSVSLAGATTIATDVAEIVLMEDDLSCLQSLFAIANKLEATLNKSLKLTIAPGILNIAGAFLFHYGILASLVVNAGFSSIALADVMKPLNTSRDETPHIVVTEDNNQYLPPEPAAVPLLQTENNVAEDHAPLL